MTKLIGVVTSIEPYVNQAINQEGLVIIAKCPKGNTFKRKVPHNFACRKGQRVNLQWFTLINNKKHGLNLENLNSLKSYFQFIQD